MYRSLKGSVHVFHPAPIRKNLCPPRRSRLCPGGRRARLVADPPPFGTDCKTFPKSGHKARPLERASRSFSPPTLISESCSTIRRRKRTRVACLIGVAKLCSRPAFQHPKAGRYPCTRSTIFGNWVREQDLNNFPPLSGNDYVVRQAMAGDIKGAFTQPRRGLGQMGDKFVTAQIWNPLGVPEDTELPAPMTGLFWMTASGEERVYAPARGEAISDAVLITNSRYVVIQVTALKRRGSAWSLEGARTEWRFVRLNP